MVDAMIITVDESSAGERIDKVICAFAKELSRSSVQKMAESGAVSVGGKPVGKNYKVKPGDKISLVIPKPRELELTPENIPLYRRIISTYEGHQI